MFDQSAKLAISQVARGLGVEPAALLAVAEIESGGKPFAHVNGKAMPLIRWEGHYFFRLLPHGLRQQGLLAHLAHPSAGGVPNPASQQARYDMLERARSIHDEAALSSCSWGLGQVMGAHWRRLGFSSVQQLVDTACSGVGGQTELMARFIRAEGRVSVHHPQPSNQQKPPPRPAPATTAATSPASATSPTTGSRRSPRGAR